MALKLPLFDKKINVSLYRANGTVAFIATPDVGRKPTLRVSGRFVSQDLIQQVELRVTNFHTDESLNQYNYVIIEAGYAGGVATAFRGKIVNSYQENPGPDGVTVFQVLVGDPDIWMTRTLSASWKPGTLLSTVLDEVATKLEMHVINYATDRALPVPLSHNGLAKDLLPRLRRLFAIRTDEDVFKGIVIQTYGDQLICFQADQGTGLVYELNYISHAMHNAAGFDIQAPWLPQLRPGDWLTIDPKFFRQDFGGAQVAVGNRFQVYLLSFDFCTTDDSNMMTLMTVGAVA